MVTGFSRSRVHGWFVGNGGTVFGTSIMCLFQYRRRIPMFERISSSESPPEAGEERVGVVMVGAR